MAEPGDPAVLPEDEDILTDDDLEGTAGLEPPPPSIAPGPRRLAIPEGEIIRRVDRFVADRTGLSRSYVQKLISEGLLVDDTGRQLRANSEVRGGAVTLEVPPVEVPFHLEPDPTIPIEVVYEDDDLLIVNKQAGLVVHPAPGHWQGTLVNALMARGDHYGGIAGVARPGIVHRLDRDTSGLLIVARNDAAQAGVMAQLKARRVRKTYLALAHGSVGASVGRIEAPIGRDPKDRKRMAVVPDGRNATTPWRATPCTARGHRARARTASSVSSSTPGGWSSSRRPRRSLSGWRRRSRTRSNRCSRACGPRRPRPAAGPPEGTGDGTGGPPRRAGGAARDHLGALRGRQGHDHRRAA